MVIVPFPLPSLLSSGPSTTTISRAPFHPSSSRPLPLLTCEKTAWGPWYCSPVVSVQETQGYRGENASEGSSGFTVCPLVILPPLFAVPHTLFVLHSPSAPHSLSTPHSLSACHLHGLTLASLSLELQWIAGQLLHLKVGQRAHKGNFYAVLSSLAADGFARILVCQLASGACVALLSLAHSPSPSSPPFLISEPSFSS